MGERDLSRSEFLQRAAMTTVALGLAGCGSSSVSRSGTTTRVTTTPVKHTPAPPRNLAAAMRGPVARPGSSAFRALAPVYNERYDGIVPRAIALPLDADDVGAAIRWAAHYGVPTRTRSGGHSYAGYSTVQGGLVLDLRHLQRIAVNSGAGTASIGAGTQLIDVYTALAAAGRTIPAGSCPSVGIGGHALGGGMGLAGRAFGLACDNIAALELVTAEGRVVQVSEQSDPDLLWALRGGGGGNFGVVTQFEMRLHPTPSSASWFFISWPWSQAAEAVTAWQTWAPRAPGQVTSIFHLEAGGGNSVLVGGQYLGPSRHLSSLLSPLTAVSGASVTSGEQDYAGLQQRWAGCLGKPLASCHTVGTRAGGTLPRESFAAKSDYVENPLPPSGVSAMVAAAEERNNAPGSGALLLDQYGGAINQVAPDATAFVHRQNLFCIQYLTYNGDEAWLRQAHARMRPYVSGMAYQNYIDPTLSGWQAAYYGANYSRLLDVQRRIDPQHFFNFPQAIGA